MAKVIEMKINELNPTENIAIEELHPHPRNYREHPDDQLEHIIKSISENGLYRPIVIARENTILAGHGVVMAARKMGLTQVSVIRLDIDSDDVRALKILTGDNEIPHLGVIDDRELTELLKEIKDFDADELLGTGFDEMMLANLVYVTRPASEIQDHNEAAQWVGMPEIGSSPEPLKVVVSFRNNTDRIEFARLLGLKFTEKTKSTWWPSKDQEDTPFQETSAILFEG